MTTEKLTIVSDITDAVEAALGVDNIELDSAQFDTSLTSSTKIIVRVRPEGWSVSDHYLDSGNEAVGVDRVSVLVRGRWQYWNYDSIRPENRKVINALQNLGWILENVDYEEDADFLETTLAFSKTEVAPY